jgi:ABC-type protease/lipase transport system fused ATPase/permease subunit
MFFRYILSQVNAIMSNQTPRLKRALWVIALCTVLTGFMELGVAGLVSLLGVALTSPAAVMAFALIIAHRLSTLEKCDMIYHMEKGTIVDYGPPEQILSHM